MDDVSLDFRGALVRVFAEFALLPDLLRLFSEGLNTVGDWAGMLDEFGYNEDHVEDEDIPDGMSLTEFMAADAMQFCRWIALIGPRGGVTPPGHRLSRIAAVPHRERDHNANRTLTRTLAVQIQHRYRGESDVPLTDLLQSASTVLASHGHSWPDGLEGLLLLEMETLLHWGFVNATAAERLVHRLPEARREVIDALRQDPEVRAGRESVDASDVADVLAEVHWGRPELALNSNFTITGLRATAMAMTFAQLLADTLATLPLQVLIPWMPLRHGR